MAREDEIVDLLQEISNHLFDIKRTLENTTDATGTFLTKDRTEAQWR